MYLTEKIGKNGMKEQLKTALENHTCLPDESLRQNLPNPNVAAHQFGQNFSTSKIRFFFLKSDFFSLSWLLDVLKVVGSLECRKNEELHLQVQIALIVEKLHPFWESK